MNARQISFDSGGWSLAGADVEATYPVAARMILRLMRTGAIPAQRKNMDRILSSSDDVMRIQGQRINARWIQDFPPHDPRPVLARVAVPVLAISGGEDVQVPPDDVTHWGAQDRPDGERAVAKPGSYRTGTSDDARRADSRN